MSRTLVIGYGNLDRGDDGAAFQVVNALRSRLGRKPLSEQETGLEELSAETEAVFIRQLVPEMMETAAGYDQIIFVDAHVGQGTQELMWAPVLPEFVPSAFTHHVTPATFLALIRALYDRNPAGHLLSLRGHDFDFSRNLSAATECLVVPAVEEILKRLPNGRGPGRGKREEVIG